MRQLAIVEVESIIARVLGNQDIYVMRIWGSGPYDITPEQMVINHGWPTTSSAFPIDAHMFLNRINRKQNY